MKFSAVPLALFTLVAFAANSILCREALVSGSIGPVEFTLIRLGAGTMALLPIIFLSISKLLSGPNKSIGRADLLKLRLSNFGPSLALFAYAIFFSLAYIQLHAGTGALILFASVQMTMIGVSIFLGNRVTFPEWIGLAVAFSGLIYLVLPGLSAPPLLGTLLMMASGIAWGVYSLLGRRQADPILSTARNFLFCLPGLALLGLIALWHLVHNDRPPMSLTGIFLAVVSGAITSGLGYVLWYLTMRRITITAASVSQLLVPILAAMGGILFLNESFSLRLMVASMLIVGGIVVTILSRRVPEAATERHYPALQKESSRESA
ncbi:conserved membrane hypothetical protein [Candidatus Zixiibacteriota bacterium]|nr:conserved membrane hypothetical protein [candidate division Zixibacteria bacterium]